MIGTALLRDLVQACTPPYFRNAHSALMPSCCAATLLSPTAPFHNPESNTKGRKTGADSSGVAANSFAASSYPSFRTFQTYLMLVRTVGEIIAATYLVRKAIL